MLALELNSEMLYGLLMIIYFQKFLLRKITESDNVLKSIWVQKIENKETYTFIGYITRVPLRRSVIPSKYLLLKLK